VIVLRYSPKMGWTINFITDLINRVIKIHNKTLFQKLFTL